MVTTLDTGMAHQAIGDTRGMSNVVDRECGKWFITTFRQKGDSDSSF
jgi:hypothetical protein